MANKKKQKKAAAPIRNNALKNAISALKGDPSPENQNAFLKETVKAKFLVPVIINADLKPDNMGRVKIAGNTQISFVMVNTNQGKTFLPVCTDLDEAKKLKVNQPGNLQYIVRTLKEYERILKDPKNTAEGLVINPMNENLVLPKPLVLTLIGSPETPAEAEAPAAALDRPVPGAVYSEPRIYPTALVNAVYDTCSELTEVSRVWLRQQMVGLEAAFAFVVEADTKDVSILEKIREKALPLAKDVPVVVMSYAPDLEEAVIQGAVPLYDRELDI